MNPDLVRSSARARFQRGLSWTTLALPVVGIVATTLLATRGGARRRDRAKLLGALTLGAGVVRWQMQRWVTETPRYRRDGWRGPLELRSYGPLVVAETEVTGQPWEDALQDGFRRVARYIFGGNARGTRISMTSPVQMTAPDAEHDVRPHTIRFLMPGDRAIGDLPAPHDPRVHLSEIPARRVAVLSFRGRYGSDLPARKAEELQRLAREAGLVTKGEPLFAGYDPPSTFPWLRRNEVMVELGGAETA